jgi:hypothetical protein
MSLPLYRRLLGTRFDELPPRVRELHDLTGPATWRGRADVERGTSLVARAMATLLSFPPTGRDQLLTVTFTPDRERERWRRQFGEKVFPSVQYERSGRLFERVGPSALVFTLEGSRDGLVLILTGVRFLGVPLPRLLHPKVRTIERDDGSRYRFEVESALPLFGLLVRYSGWLEKAAGKP